MDIRGDTFPQNSQKYLLCWLTSIFLICFLKLAPYRVPEIKQYKYDNLIIKDAGKTLIIKDAGETLIIKDAGETLIIKDVVGSYPDRFLY